MGRHLPARFLQGIRTSIAKKSHSYVIFQGGRGGPDPLSPFLDQRMIYLTSPTEEA